ncbi:ATP-binding cassette domain-containing protein [Exiguobacterium acetylicum]|uniref:ATP-binding cassette domain-containing protein n=1 Tax=Exiguobacterium acetylicum TaxID=41170 RepID=UPI0027E1E4E7|nr:ATP-binding cassette domain-containing protein [Exiguobacterium acetylicum]MDQ6468830.1 ATP-binding cassette domain-containing protein [Exiguobacterium acetylicum]
MEIKLIDCTKKFKDKIILDKINFSIPSGLYQLIGRNGAGKSTILKILANLDGKYSGEVVSMKKSILYLSVDPIGIHPFSIQENVEILWNTFDIKPNEESVSRIHTFFDNNMDTSYSSCSTGMKAKVGLSLVFSKDWDIVLIDETMSSLDSQSIEMLSERLVEMSKSSIIIYVSHSMVNERLKNESRVILLEEGELLWSKSR